MPIYIIELSPKTYYKQGIHAHVESTSNKDYACTFDTRIDVKNVIHGIKKKSKFRNPKIIRIS